MSQDTKSEIDPAMTPLFVGMGVELEGTVRHRGPQDEKAVVLGTLKGDIEWNGILQVPKGGKVLIDKSLRVREMVVGGEVLGTGDHVVIETGLLRVGESGIIDVAMVSLPTGGLEQARGSVINAQLRMATDHLFALVANDIAASLAPAADLVVAGRGGTEASVDADLHTSLPPSSIHSTASVLPIVTAHGRKDGDHVGALVQIETRSVAA